MNSKSSNSSSSSNSTRQCIVSVPDDLLSENVVPVRNRTTVMEIIDLISADLNIESYKNYFGLVYDGRIPPTKETQTTLQYPRWLSSDKLLVKDHAFINKLDQNEPIRLSFQVKYYARRL